MLLEQVRWPLEQTREKGVAVSDERDPLSQIPRSRGKAAGLLMEAAGIEPAFRSHRLSRTASSVVMTPR